MMKYGKYTLNQFIEQTRKNRKISQEELTEGIIHVKTYRRLIGGKIETEKVIWDTLLARMGDKERLLQIGNPTVLQILSEYKQDFSTEIEKCGYFFVNQSGTHLSDQAVRRMITKYCNLASIDLHITPHIIYIRINKQFLILYCFFVIS